MKVLTSTDRSTIAKLLGMVGSAHDAEALTAARKANMLVKAKGATWVDLLTASPAPPPPASPAPPQPHHLTEARDLLKRGKKVLTRWEHDFLLGIMSFRVLRPAQAETLDGIRRKIAAATGK